MKDGKEIVNKLTLRTELLLPSLSLLIFEFSVQHQQEEEDEEEEEEEEISNWKKGISVFRSLLGVPQSKRMRNTEPFEKSSTRNVKH
ncbi:hypothetical protein OUZ56_018313 [Daphnia magna]|uniref:Uncharacterized protein n=1 Tax=Daphnia magna TaxID=35525 RepID=A0ABQ9Z951_9CRUS|nr:hypothetical protein OUZ56_018313 [Daphnia magna]